MTEEKNQSTGGTGAAPNAAATAGGGSATTKMVARPAAVRLVKIRALRDIQWKEPRERMEGEDEFSYRRAPYHLHTLREGEVAEVPEAVAAEYCDKTFVGTYNFFGERSNHDEHPRHIIRRAERVS